MSTTTFHRSCEEPFDEVATHRGLVVAKREPTSKDGHVALATQPVDGAICRAVVQEDEVPNAQVPVVGEERVDEQFPVPYNGDDQKLVSGAVDSTRSGDVTGAQPDQRHSPSVVPHGTDALAHGDRWSCETSNGANQVLAKPSTRLHWTQSTGGSAAKRGAPDQPALSDPTRQTRHPTATSGQM